jgi:radical SAM superfamily enzyme YgiQ (UPF0313 family)
VRLLLVSTYELGHQPLHVASPAARLLEEGHEVRCLDLAIEAWDWSLLEWAEAVAFSVPMHTAMRLAVSVAEEVKQSHPSMPIVFYGLYAAASSDRIVGNLAERVIVGEYEDELVAWAELDRSDFAKSGDRAVRVDLGLKRFRRPARYLLPPLARYAQLRVGNETRIAGYVEASHGCRHRCRHCPIPAVYDGRFRATGLDTVLGDVKQQVGAGARHITFGDPDFLNAPRYALDVIEAVNGSLPDLTFDITVKVEHILEHRDLWPKLAELNVLFVVSAFETTNDRVLRILDKGHTRSDLEEGVRILRAAGVHVRPSWMPFTPWTEAQDLPMILQFLSDQDLMASVDPVQLSIRLLLPEGSLLLGRSEMDAHLDGYDPESLSYRWISADPAMDVLQADLALLAEQGIDDQASTLEAIWERVMGEGILSSWALDQAPRLTESWFCCAEPTSLQRGMVSLARQP